MKTILDAFITTKRKQHVEPKRVNVPKGNKIGMSKPKYEAAMISALCNFDLKSLAEHLNGSYECVRRWRSEEAFKEQCNQFKDEFQWTIDIELEALAAEIVSAFKAGQFDADLKDRFLIFKDFNIYNQQIVDHVEELLKKYLSLDGGELLFFDLIQYLATCSENPRFIALLTQVRKSLREGIFDRVIAAIGNSEMPENEREVITLCLNKILK